MLPASETKHIQQLSYEFQGRTWILRQRDDHGLTNGTTLWLGGQILAYYLLFVLDNKQKKKDGQRPKAIELGSGIGLTALALASLGWDVCCTDVEPVLSSVLRPNIVSNNGSQMDEAALLQCKELDWTVEPELWTWAEESHIASQNRVELEKIVNSSPQIRAQGEAAAAKAEAEANMRALEPPFDLILTADTLYNTSLVSPLLRSLHHLARRSTGAGARYSCPIYLCVEQRDPELMTKAYDECKSRWGFHAERIKATKIRRSLEKAGIRWAENEWIGVEIWKLKLPNDSAMAR